MALRRQDARRSGDGGSAGSSAPPRRRQRRVAVARGPQVAAEALVQQPARPARGGRRRVERPRPRAIGPERSPATCAFCGGVVHVRCQVELGAVLGVVDEVPELQRPLEVCAGLREGDTRSAASPASHVGAQRHGQCGEPPSSGGPARPPRRALAEARVGAQRPGEGGVQRGALAGQQLVVDRLLQQRVAEGVASRRSRRARGRRRPRAARRAASALGQLGDRGEQPWSTRRPAAAATRSTACAVGQRARAAASSDVAQAAEAARRAAPPARQQLLGEERVALGARVDRARPASASAPAPRIAGQLLGELGRGRSGSARGARPPRGARARPAAGAADGGGAARRCGRCRRAARRSSCRLRSEEGEEVERRAVGPVQVLDHEDHRRVGRPAAPAARAAARTAGPARRVARGDVPSRRRLWGASSGTSRASSAARRSEQLVDGGRVLLARSRRSAAATGAYGSSPAPRPRTRRPARAPRDPARARTPRQPRLADARLAGDEHGGRHPRAARSSAASSTREVRDAPDEVGTGDAAWHTAIISARHQGRERAHARRSRRLRSRPA